MRVKFRCKRCARDIEANFTRAGKMAQCPGCHYTQEIPDPSGGGGDGGGDAPPPKQQTAGGGGGGGGGPPAAAPRKGGGGGVDAIIKKIIVFVILAIAAFVAYKFGKGRWF
ncbi:MAG: hypothetical protein FD180_4236 [Planctomycetota bacterium]|nr:MAG: hypothetical protein FD180_4236 [Planctomycetota bacterium]